jgi:catechol 2,3-dioxygenase-like lactoylglutathione lyase family enzyme
MFRKIMYTTLFVSDQDKALEFYTATLGFQKRIDASGPEGRFLTVALGAGPEVLLWPGTAGRGETSAKAPIISVPGQLILESDDLLRDCEAMRARGVKFEAGPEEYAFGLRATVIDLDGNRVSLRQPRTRG